MTARAACALAGAWACAPAAMAGPANETCALAQVVVLPGLNSTTKAMGTNFGAASEIAQTCAGDDAADVWYSFTASATGVYTFDTATSVLYNTTLAIYSGCGAGATLLGCNDNIDAEHFNFWSVLVLNMTAGQNVKIRVSSPGDEMDDFTLNITATGPLTNDSCSTPEPIFVNQPRIGSTMRAVSNLTLPLGACGPYSGSDGGRDVFYSFTPAQSDLYTISTCGSNFDTVLAVLSNCSGTAQSVVACNDNSLQCDQFTGSRISQVGLYAGTPYLIRVAGHDFEPADMGTFTLVVSSGYSGLCCRGSTCAILAQSACATGGGNAGVVFDMNVFACGTPTSATPCCHADYNKTLGVTVADIFDYLMDWFASRPAAAFGTGGTSAPTVQHTFSFLSAWFAGCD